VRLGAVRAHSVKIGPDMHCCRTARPMRDLHSLPFHYRSGAMRTELGDQQYKRYSSRFCLSGSFPNTQRCLGRPECHPSRLRLSANLLEGVFACRMAFAVGHFRNAIKTGHRRRRRRRCRRQHRPRCRAPGGAAADVPVRMTRLFESFIAGLFGRGDLCAPIVCRFHWRTHTRGTRTWRECLTMIDLVHADHGFLMSVDLFMIPSSPFTHDAPSIPGTLAVDHSAVLGCARALRVRFLTVFPVSWRTSLCHVAG